MGVTTACNVGGFGIDGDVSTLIGASLVHEDKLYFAVVGDLAFFYDLNVLGNRHVGKNVRIMLINNGRGTEFHNSDHPASKFGAEGDPYIAAAGHYGNKSPELVKHYAQDLGYEYMTASTKEEYLTSSALSPRTVQWFWRCLPTAMTRVTPSTCCATRWPTVRARSSRWRASCSAQN